MKSKHVLLINRKLSFIPETLLYPEVECINLHCNNLEKITGISNLMHLTSLDLSSNKLASISGLTGLPLLKSLNLASNFISKVEGIGELLQLKYINLSYNRISLLHGFLDLHGPNSNLQIILLHENQLESKNHVIACMKGLISLRHLVLNWNYSDNALINDGEIRKEFLEKLPQLTSIDLLNRHEEPVDIDDELESISIYSNSLNLVSHECEMASPVLSTSVSEVSPLLSPASISKKTTVDVAILSTESLNEKKMSSDQTLKSNVLSEISNEQCLKITPENETPSTKSSKSFVARSKTPSKTDAGTSKTMVKRSKTSLDVDTISNQNRKVVVKSARTFQRNRRSSIPVKNSTKQSIKRTEKESLVNILKELETEREQRWKAEEASKKLVTVIREMQSRSSEKKSLQEAAAATTERLKQALLSEKKTCEELKNDSSVKDNQILSLNQKLNKISEKFRVTVDTLKKSLADANAKITRMQAKTDKEKKDLQGSLRQLSDKYESICYINQHLKIQLESLRPQNTNENNNKRKCCTFTDVEFQKALESELKKDEKRHQAEISLLEHQLQSKQSELSQLECEFREALLIESKRFKSLEEKFSAVNDKACKYETLVSVASDKEEKFRSMIAQMTSVIKEQKLKITETVNSKQELSKCYEKQLIAQQQEINLSKNHSAHYEKIKRENADLSSKLFALQSVVDGLKEERKLWSLDLAEQGVALSKDRGWLEMKIESLKTEVEALKNNNKRDLDSLRIKTKIVEDQTETILRFKEELSLKDKVIRKKLDEKLVEQQQLLQASEDLINENTLLKEENKTLISRKQQLKNELTNLQHDYAELQENFEKQKLKWLEKGNVLMKLEQQVKHFSVNNREKIEQLVKERDNALSAAQLMKDKNNSLSATYEEQLKAAGELHKQEMQRLVRNKEEEVNRMKAEVDRVETEMKELLKETGLEKKKMEVKVCRLKALLEEVS